MNKSKVSVILLTYNSSRTIEKCLLSLESQSNKEFEVLIVDDNSTDDTIEKIKRLEKELSYNIRYLKNGAHSISVGRNIGIKNTKTQYYTFLDSDAYADKNWIKNFLIEFKKNKDICIVGGDTIPIYYNKLSYANGLVYQTIRELTRKGVWKLEGGNAAYDKNKLKGIYFNEKFKHCEDIEFFTRVNKKYKTNYSNKIKIIHESKDTIKKFFRQQYEYAKWETIFSLGTKRKIRLLSFIPSLMILLTLILLLLSPYFILFIPFISFFEAALTILIKRIKIILWQYIFISWLIKNIGWGLGVIAGIGKILTKNYKVKSL